MCRARWKENAVKMLLALLLVLSMSCSLRSTTEFIRPPFLPDVQESFKKEQMSSCLAIEKIKSLLSDTNDETLAPLRHIVSDMDGNNEKDALTNRIEKIVEAEQMKCGSVRPQWELLYDVIRKNHDGLFLFDETGADYPGRLKKALSQSKRVSISYHAPASMSMSTRALPSEQEPGNTFRLLSERAQASLINYAQAFRDAKSTTGPEKALEALLDKIGQSAEARYAATRRVELTVSSALNSATTEDRFDYIAAYLSLPPMPYTLNGSVSLEKEFLEYLQSVVVARRSGDRWKHVEADVRRALDSIRISIEIVDALKTEAATIQLGKITSSGGLAVGPFGEYGTAVQSGDTARTLGLSKGVGASLSVGREDAIAKELDKRSFWINPDRTLFRITQRGMQEATISGSMSSALTIKVPKTSLYVISIEETDAPKADAGNTKKKKQEKGGAGGSETKSYSLKLGNVEQPLYASVNAMGVVLGTVRIAEQPGLSFKKEPDGVAYSVAEGPFRLKLWKNERVLWSFDLLELLPGFRFSGNDRASLARFVVYSRQPYVYQEARFEKEKSVLRLIELIHKEKALQLVKHRQKRFYLVLPCNQEKGDRDKELQRNEPGLNEFWLGIHIDGKPIKEEEWGQLDQEIGRCSKEGE